VIYVTHGGVVMLLVSLLGVARGELPGVGRARGGLGVRADDEEWSVAARDEWCMRAWATRLPAHGGHMFDQMA